ncbi:MAG: Dabb family protein [Pseudomonadota bacterium]
MKRILIIVLLCFTFVSCATTNTHTNEQIVHIVLVWLKEQGNQQHIDQIIEATKQLKEIVELKKLNVGKSIPSDRKIVDDSFDIGIYMTFSSVEDMQSYLSHPKHKRAVHSVFRPLAANIVVYDFTDQTN